MDKFTLSIELGNDGMQDELDVIEALTTVIHQLGDRRTAARILDVNGTKVGKWELS